MVYICTNANGMPSTINQLESQVKAMQKRLQEIPKTIGGAYNRKFYSLQAKIKNTVAVIDKLKWNEFLAK